MNDHQSAEPPQLAKDAGSTIDSVASDLRAAASTKYQQALREARLMADDTKADIANEVKDVASALRRASEELRDGSAQERTLGQIASTLADASESIRDKDIGEILAMVSRKGRENPILFLGGAALLGFAASRYAKASSSQTHTPDASDKDDRKKAQISDFVSEGNPNTQPSAAMP